MTEAATPQFKLDDIVKKYIELRDQVDAINDEAKKRIEPIQTAMRTIETYLMDLLNKQGQTKIGTEHGTAFITVKTGCNIIDKDAYWSFLMADPAGRRELLTLSANKTNVEKFIEANGGVTPPGINFTAMKAVQIRRA